MSEATGLFDDPDFLSKLAYLDLVAKQIIAGTRRGERRTGRRGTGTLFKDYRSYSRGDDRRYVDWNIYGRLGALFVKEFEVEESANVLLFLDRSLSMDFGSPAKLEFARKVAAALGYIALSHLDQVEVVPIPGGPLDIRTFVGKGQAPALFEYLASLEPQGDTDLFDSVRRCLAGGRPHGVSILISDLYDPKGFRPALDLLLHKRHRVFLVHVVAPQEADPDLRGALRLVDSETGRRIDVGLDKKMRVAYREAYRRFVSRVESYAKKREFGHSRFTSDLPFGEAVLSLLRRSGVVH